MSPTKHARGGSGEEPKLHRWQNGEKTLGETRLSRGGSSPPARRTSSLFQLQQSQSVRGPLVPGVFSRCYLGDEVHTGDLSLGLIYVSWTPLLLQFRFIWFLFAFSLTLHTAIWAFLMYSYEITFQNYVVVFSWCNCVFLSHNLDFFFFHNCRFTSYNSNVSPQNPKLAIPSFAYSRLV